MTSPGFLISYLEQVPSIFPPLKLMTLTNVLYSASVTPALKRPVCLCFGGSPLNIVLETRVDQSVCLTENGGFELERNLGTICVYGITREIPEVGQVW